MCAVELWILFQAVCHDTQVACPARSAQNTGSCGIPEKYEIDKYAKRKLSNCHIS